ncbi:MAG: hypothetical protein KGS44_08595 [Alphaproteobacteria bacterium]|nr:hypothetical protein [Alphaproteobacteria bacterium]
MAAKEGIFGRILAEVRASADHDRDGVRGRLAGRSGARDGGSVRSRLLQGLARSGGLSRQVSFGAASGKGATPELRLNTRQRVIVKAHVAKHGVRGFGGGGGGGALRAHVVYLGREGRDGPERGAFYDRDDEGLDAKVHVRDWAEDRHHFRFIVSPEHGDKLDDLRGYVRDLMDEVASDLKESRLDWIAVNHFDTDQPHAHVLVRGAREDGRALIIPKDYMARGFRARAEERATRELGEVSRGQAEERLRKEVTADRVTGLDRHLEKSLRLEGRVPSDLIDDRHTYGALMRGRLQHLEGLALRPRRAETGGSPRASPKALKACPANRTCSAPCMPGWPRPAPPSSSSERARWRDAWSRPAGRAWWLRIAMGWSGCCSDRPREPRRERW